jgi:cytochrome b561
MARRDRYDAVAIGLHWLIALGIGAQLLLGLDMVQFETQLSQKFYLYQLHKSIGITVLLAVLVRVAWRLTHRPPPLPPAMPGHEKAAAEGVHYLLYALMLGLPLTGWALASASVFNIPTVLYGSIPWPHLPVLSTLSNKAPVETALKWTHAWLAWAIIAVLALHVGAVIRHLWKGDGMIRRMLPLPTRATIPNGRI